MREELKAETMRNLQEIKVVENEEHGQNYIDNHTGQNYNVEHFWRIIEFPLIFRVRQGILNNIRISVCQEIR